MFLKVILKVRILILHLEFFLKIMAITIYGNYEGA